MGSSDSSRSIALVFHNLLPHTTPPAPSLAGLSKWVQGIPSKRRPLVGREVETSVTERLRRVSLGPSLLSDLPMMGAFASPPLFLFLLLLSHHKISILAEENGGNFCYTGLAMPYPNQYR